MILFEKKGQGGDENKSIRENTICGENKENEKQQAKEIEKSLAISVKVSSMYLGKHVVKK